ncbi:MAG: hypothetical protein ABII76_05660, partial [Pseudomonadota bacterium]
MTLPRASGWVLIMGWICIGSLLRVIEGQLGGHDDVPNGDASGTSSNSFSAISASTDMLADNTRLSRRRSTLWSVFHRILALGGLGPT